MNLFETPTNFCKYSPFITLAAVVSTAFAANFYTNQWVVKIDTGSDVADQLAHKYGFVNKAQIMPKHYLFQSLKLRRKRSTHIDRHHRRLFARETNIIWSEQQIAKSRVKRYIENSNDSSTFELNDPMWAQMWYLNRSGPDHNVLEAWNLGFTGRNVVLAVLDDGLETQHPDLRDNYDSLASTDINDQDDDPSPRYDVTKQNRHGTRCAGQIAAVANNGICIPGVAFNAKIGGIRMLDGDVTDAVEAASMSHNPQHIDIYVSNWGPDDDGRTFDGPGRLTKAALERGTELGRDGKGSIFVWSSGNGGRDNDNCNCDGYVTSIYTISISSASQNGRVPWYSEKCTSILATAYSSGSRGEQMISTTDLHSSCTSSHTGTSASTSIAAGIIALTLEANSELTWRDLQHIIVRTSKSEPLNSSDWHTNGAGLMVSHYFGFGLLDAGAMVQAALNWTSVPQQNKCVVDSIFSNRTIASGSMLEIELDSETCQNTTDKLEHVQVYIELDAPKRGDIEIFLTSPSSTNSTLLTKRKYDRSRNRLKWTFTTVHHWAETGTGNWLVQIYNGGRDNADLWALYLTLYGTRVEQSETETSNNNPPDQRKRECERLNKQMLEVCYGFEFIDGDYD